MLIDSFGRRISYLRISITDRCNLRCVYCMPITGVQWLPRNRILHYEEIREIVRLAARLGITKIRLTGGEPLVREGVEDLIRMLVAIPELEDLAMTTNGVLLAQHAKALAHAGLRRVNVSLDTLKPERFKSIARFGSAADVERGIEAALQAGLDPVKLNVVVMRPMNEDEIEAFGRLTLDRPLHVRFIELMPLGEDCSREKLVPSQEILDRLEVLGGIRPTLNPGGCGPAQSFSLPGAQGTIGLIGAVTQAFCAQCNRMRLTSTGRLRPCLDDTQATDLMPALRPKIDAQRLEAMIRYTVSVKPEQHAMAERETGSSKFCMSGIGG